MAGERQRIQTVHNADVQFRAKLHGEALRLCLEAAAELAAHVFFTRFQAACKISSRNSTLCSSNSLLARRKVENIATGSAFFVFFGSVPVRKESAGMPSQSTSAAKPSTSGRFPWAMRVNVEALTPASLATSLHDKPFRFRRASSAP